MAFGGEHPCNESGIRRSAIAFGLLTVAIGLLYTLVVGPLVEHSGGWWIVPDAWLPLRASSFVANGALGYIYQSTPLFENTPLLPILLVPVALIEQLLRLVEGFPIPVPHPSAWLVYGPYGFALCTVVFYAARRLATELGIDRDRLGAQVGILVLVVIPAAVVWGHYEDVLALAFVMLGIRALLRRRSLSAALLFGVAILFKQWALLGVPLLIAASAPDERRRVAAASLILPGLLVAFPLLVDWPHASVALIWARSYPQAGHRALWISSTARVVAANPERVGAFFVALAVGWWLRGRTEPGLLLAGFGVVFLARLLFEPVVFAYYLCPALGLLLLHERVATGGYRRTMLLGICLLLFSAIHPPEPIWWAVAVALGAMLCGPAVRDVVSRACGAVPVEVVPAS